MRKFPIPDPIPPPDPTVPFRFIRKLVSNTKEALKGTKDAMHDLSEEIKKPFDQVDNDEDS